MHSLARAEEPLPSLADRWMEHEHERQLREVRANRWFVPIFLGVNAVGAAGFGALATDVPAASRGFAVAGGVLAAAAIFPSVTAKSQSRSRMWFGLGSLASSAALGASLFFADPEPRPHDEGYGDARTGTGWLGLAIAVSSLTLMPGFLLPGRPELEDYERYRTVPLEQRDAVAARLLRRLDQADRRGALIGVLSSLAAAAVAAVGASTLRDPEERKVLLALGIPQLVTLAVALPTLFRDTRLERFVAGDPPRKSRF